MIKWIRPSGSEIVTNDLKRTIETAEDFGWKRKDAEVKPKRRGRPPKEKKEELVNGDCQ